MMMKKILLLMMIAALVFSCKTKQPLTSTRALETVNVGAAPNDGTGDPLRTAFQKVNAAIEVMNDVSLDQATGSTGTGNLVFSASPTLTGTVTLPTATSIGDVSSTEIGYLDGVTSAIQTWLNGKLNISDTADMADGYVRVVDIPAASGYMIGLIQQIIMNKKLMSLIMGLIQQVLIIVMLLLHQHLLQ